MAKTATAAVWNGPAEGFRLSDVPLPTLAAGEVLVETRAATLCGSDLHTIAGERETPLPTVLGHEMVGDVVGVGGRAETHDGRPVEPGMRVTWTIGASCGTCRRCVRGLPQKCVALRKYGHAAMTGDWALSGGLASHCHLVAGTGIVAVPDSMPDALSTPANCATATVVCAARKIGVAAGETVVVTGCGMLGLTTVAYLRSLGVRDVVACDVDAARRSLAERAGASVAVAPDELAGAVRELTGGEGVEAVLDMSGSNAAITSALDLLAIGGRLGLVGSVFPTPAIEIVPEAMVRGLLTVTGVHNYAPDDLVEAVRFLDEHADRALFCGFVPDTFPLDRLDDAVAHAVAKRPPRVAVDPRQS